MSVNYLGLPSTVKREVEEARSIQKLMGNILALMFGVATVSIFLYADMVDGAVDGFALASAGACALLALVSLALGTRTMSTKLFVAPVVVGTLIQVGMALHYRRVDAGFFLLLPAFYIAIFYWRERKLCIALTLFCLTAFVVEPLYNDGNAGLARVVMTSPIFLGLALITGYLGSESQRMRRKRGRFQSTISSLLVALQERDGYTADHSEETVDLAMAVGDELSITEEERMVLADVALLHDIGKIGIPNEILNKQGGLDDHEWEFMKKHPEIGERIVAPVPGFLSVAKAIRHEHERWDGEGYPDGIAGEEIPLASRIVLVCDAFHAMITDRPYRLSIGLEMARAEMVRNAGTQFDPEVVDALLAVIDDNAIPDSVGRASWNDSVAKVAERTNGSRTVLAG